MTKTQYTRNRKEHLHPSKDYQKSTTNNMYIGQMLEAFLLESLYLFNIYCRSKPAQ